MSVDIDYSDVCETWEAAVEDARKQRRETVLKDILRSLVSRPDVRHFLFEEDTEDIRAGTWGVLIEEYNSTVLMNATNDEWDENKHVQFVPTRDEVCDFTLDKEPDNIYE